MNNQTEYDEHVEYVAGELKLFYLEHDVSRPHNFENEAQARAKDIVQWVSSTPVSRWPSRDFTIGYVVGGVSGVFAVWLAGVLL